VPARLSRMPTGTFSFNETERAFCALLVQKQRYFCRSHRLCFGG
jgi:hypothetical protein